MTFARLAAVLAAFALAAVLAPAAASADAQSGVNQTPITIVDDAPASPYPSAIDIAGMQGRITDVYVSVKNLYHPTPGDLDILLVAPSGRASILMSDACIGTGIYNRTFTFHQQANQLMPQVGGCAEYFYRPSNYENELESWVDAPQVNHPTTLDTFIGDDPNGMWRLMILDDDDKYDGKVANGWSLTVETQVPDATLPGAGGTGAADPYPMTRTVSGFGGVVTDVDVTLGGLYHERPIDLDVLLVGPRGQHVMLMSDACGQWLVKRAQWTWSANGGGPMAGPLAVCFGSTFDPTDHDPTETALPAPAPAGPYGSDLTAFDLTDPNGDWKLYVADDDLSTGTGFLTEKFRLDIQTRPGAGTGLDVDALTVDEGKAGELTLTRTTPYQRLGRATVTLTTTPGTAGAGSDFAPVATSVEFAPSEATKSVAVRALTDALPEDVETFDVAITGTSGDASPVGRQKATVSIRDVRPPEVVEPTGAGADGGAGPGGDGGVAGGDADRLAPTVGAVRVARRRTARFTLSEPAAVTLQVLRVEGRRTRVARTIRRAGRAGANALGLGKRLRRGRYRVCVVAVDAAGNRSAPRTRTFRVIARLPR